jgi:hypothetical protein
MFLYILLIKIENKCISYGESFFLSATVSHLPQMSRQLIYSVFSFNLNNLEEI